MLCLKLHDSCQTVDLCENQLFAICMYNVLKQFPVERGKRRKLIDFDHIWKNFLNWVCMQNIYSQSLPVQNV